VTGCHPVNLSPQPSTLSSSRCERPTAVNALSADSGVAVYACKARLFRWIELSFCMQENRIRDRSNEQKRSQDLEREKEGRGGVREKKEGETEREKSSLRRCNRVAAAASPPSASQAAIAAAAAAASRTVVKERSVLRRQLLRCDAIDLCSQLFPYRAVNEVCRWTGQISHAGCNRCIDGTTAQRRRGYWRR